MVVNNYADEKDIIFVDNQSIIENPDLINVVKKLDLR